MQGLTRSALLPNLGGQLDPQSLAVHSVGVSIGSPSPIAGKNPERSAEACGAVTYPNIHAQPIDLAISFWHSQGICFHAPVTESEIKSVFADCGCSVTADVLELYQRVNGFADGMSCWNHWSLWSLAKIREENQFNPSQDIWFADYLIDSHYFSLHPEDSQSSSAHVQVYDKRGVDTFKVADTLAEFLQRLLSDPESVHVFPLGDAEI